LNPDPSGTGSETLLPTTGVYRTTAITYRYNNQCRSPNYFENHQIFGKQHTWNPDLKKTSRKKLPISGNTEGEVKKELMNFKLKKKFCPWWKSLSDKIAGNKAKR